MMVGETCRNEVQCAVAKFEMTSSEAFEWTKRLDAKPCGVSGIKNVTDTL